MNTNFPVSKATGRNKAEILELWDEYILRDRFGHNWEAIEYHVFGEQASDIFENCFIAKDSSKNGKIISTVAALPMTLMVEGTTVNATAITGVATRPEFRKQGLMTRLMTAALESAENQKRPLSLLWGYRDRYRHFGFEICGKLKKYFIPGRKFKHLDAKDTNCIKELKLPRDKQVIEKLGSPSNLVLTNSQLYAHRVFQRALQKSYIYRRDSVQAIVTINISPLANKKLLEAFHISGDFKGIMKLLSFLMNTGDYEECVITQPGNSADDLAKEIFDISEWFHLEHICNIRINSLAGLMNNLEPYLLPILKNLGLSIKLTMVRNQTRESWSYGDKAKKKGFNATFSDTELVRLLFGPEKPTELPFMGKEAGMLDELFPIPFYISPLEGL